MPGNKALFASVAVFALVLALLLRHYDFGPTELRAAAERIPVIGGLFACSHRDNKETVNGGDRLFTENELEEYAGDKGLYLAFLGNVYNVQKGEKHYGIGKAYHHFTGKDASRAFVTGDFSKEGLRDDVLDLKYQDLLGLCKWKDNYNTNYEYVGKLIGRYFDENGEQSEYGVQVERAFEAAEKQKLAHLEDQKQFPPCNTEWIHEVGGRVWCTNESGGIHRDWVGVPRQRYSPDSGQIKCVCVHPSNLNDPALKVYDNCQSDADSCPIK